MPPKFSKRKVRSTLLGYLIFGFIIPSVFLGIGAALYFAAEFSLPIVGSILVGIFAAGLLIVGIAYLVSRSQKNSTKTATPGSPRTPTAVKTEKEAPVDLPHPSPEPEPRPPESLFNESSVAAKGLLMMRGTVDKASFEACCKEPYGVAPSKVVFIFPGNQGHHTPAHSLFSVKSGNGLAQAAGELAEAGYATLSLPTANMDNWNKDETLTAIVHNAIADLYKAAGADFSLMLPIRSHKAGHYFESVLSFAPEDEPSFWGEEIKTANPALAKYYLEELEALNKFLKSSEDEKEQSPFYPAYREGQKLTGRKNFSVLTSDSMTTFSPKPR